MVLFDPLPNVRKLPSADMSKTGCPESFCKKGDLNVKQNVGVFALKQTDHS